MAIPAIVAGIMGSLTGMAGDVKSPAKGATQISPKEGGLYQLSPKDDLMAAPGLLDFFKSMGGGLPIGDLNYSTNEGGLGLIPNIPSFDSAALRNLTGGINNAQPTVTVEEHKKVLQDVMAPLFSELKTSVVDNTMVSTELKKVQEDAPRRLGDKVAENIFYSRY